jgi:hypothetical protein
MAKKSSAERQKARQRKAEKKKQKRSLHARALSKTRVVHGLPGSAGQWPLLECWLTEEWQDVRQIVQILVARRGPRDEIAVGVFLVDLGCLGLKNASLIRLNTGSCAMT